ncbi:MAG: hypothetical protein VKI82_08240 [Leptolyngbya sp.]|nr:hypothetical protein [Leptolyngbya sp.]
MTTHPSFPPTLLKGDLLRLVPIDLETAEDLGTITEVWVDRQRHRVLGIGWGGGLGRRRQRFAWEQVISIGHDGVVLGPAMASTDSAAEDPASTDPAAEDPAMDGLVLDDIEVWSDHGDRLGYLTDYCFAPQDGQILHYHVSLSPGPDRAPGCYAIPPEAVISLGRRRMMIAHPALATAERLGDPVSPRPMPPRTPLDALPLDQVLDHIPDPKQTWDATLDKTRQARTQFTEQWQNQGQRLQSGAQQRLGNWIGGVKKHTRHLRHQLRETVSDVTAGLPDPPQRRRGEPPSTVDVDATELWGDDD